MKILIVLSSSTRGRDRGAVCDRGWRQPVRGGLG